MFNEQFSKEEYEARTMSLDLGNAAQRQAITERLQDIRARIPQLAVHQFSSENCIGNHLSECVDCYRCHDSFACEDSLFLIETNGNKNCCDLTVAFENEWCYQAIHSPMNYNSNFIFHCDYCSDAEFCAFSKNLKNCFGCVYVQNKEYYILNEGPFAPEDYQQRVAAIKAELQSIGHYNLLPYLQSEYEEMRLTTETDSSIATLPPTI